MRDLTALLNKEEKKDKRKIIYIFIILLIIALPILIILNGIILMKFWEWFIVSIFPLPTLTLVQALGMGMFLSYTLYNFTLHLVKWEKDKRATEDIYPRITVLFLVKLLFLGTGWGFHYLFY